MSVHTRTTRTALVVLAGGALALGPAVAPAGAASTQVGQSFSSNGMDCSIAAGGYTVLQTASAANTYRVPAAGVITAWKTQPRGTEAGGQVALKIGRGSGSAYSIVGTSDLAAVSGTTLTGTARIPVQVGDVIGGFYSAPGNCARMAAATETAIVYAGNLPPGPAGTPASSGSGIQLNMEATLEPDADGDGFGDATQDLCPTKATTQRECTPPVTAVTGVSAKKAKKKANGKYKKAAATVVFAVSEAASSTCSIDGAAATACSSPFVFKAKKGTHAVTVTSTDTAGNVGAPVRATVTIKKAKPKK